MRPVLPRNRLPFDKPDVGFIDENGRLEGVTSALASHTALRDLMKFPLDERNQLLEGVLVAFPPLQKQPGDRRRRIRNLDILNLEFTRRRSSRELFLTCAYRKHCTRCVD